MRQFTEVILPDANAVKSNNLKNKQLFVVLCGEISVPIGPIPRLFVTDALFAPGQKRVKNVSLLSPDRP